MYPASKEFREKIYSGSKLFARAEITLADNTKLTFEKDDFAMGANGFSVNKSSSSTSSFDVGGVFAGQLNIKLINYDGQLDNYDFDGAQIKAEVGLSKNDGTNEFVRFGTFYVDTQDFSGGIVSLTAFDKIGYMNEKYSGRKSGRASEFIYDICGKYGVIPNFSEMNNSNSEIELADSDLGYTDRDIISYILQITGNYGFIDDLGNFVARWYDLSALQAMNIINAKTFSDKAEDIIEAGNFADMSSIREVIDAGTFDEGRENIAIVNTIFSSKIDIGDVIITGIRVIDDDNNEYLAGEEGYCLTIQNNPFVTSSNAQNIAQTVYSVAGGTVFRPVNLSVLNNPLYQVGDVALVETDSNIYSTILTNINYSVGRFTEISCGTESPGKNNGIAYSQETRAYIKSKKEMARALSDYDIMVKHMNELIVNSLGFHEIREEQEDGSVIIYLANKPTLSESIGGIVWRIALNVFSVTTNYQGSSTQWQSGFDSSGNAVVNILSAIGITFDWARGGTIALGGENNSNGVLEAKDSNGKTKVKIDKNGITLANGTNISWNNISGKPDDIITDDNKGTYITEDFISSLKVIAGSVAAEDIFGTYINGKILNGSKIIGSTANFGTFDESTSSMDKIFMFDEQGRGIMYAGRNYLSTERKQLLFMGWTGINAAAYESYIKQGYTKGEAWWKASTFTEVGWIGFSKNIGPYFSGLSEKAKYSENEDTLFGWRGAHSINYMSVGTDSSGEWYLHTSITSGDSGTTYDYGISMWESDERFKDNIVPTKKSGLDFIDKVEHVEFDWNDKSPNDGHVDIGYIAQQLEEIEPQTVSKIKQQEGSYIDEIYQINESAVIPYLSKAIQELHAIVKEQQAKIEELEAKINGN